MPDLKAVDTTYKGSTDFFLLRVFIYWIFMKKLANGNYFGNIICLERGQMQRYPSMAIVQKDSNESHR